MDPYQMALVTEATLREQSAKEVGRKDPLTRSTLRFVQVTTNILSVILIPIQVVTTFVTGLMYPLTLGLFGFIYAALWWTFLAVLLLTSRLWLRLWSARPLLVLPGILVVLVGHIDLTLVSEPQSGRKYYKLTLADAWPLTWYVFRPPDDSTVNEFYRDVLG